MLDKKIMAGIIMVLMMVLLFPCGASAEEEPEVVAEAAVLMDVHTGQILFAKEGMKQMYPASTTKILTAYVTLKHCALDDVVTVSDKAVMPGGSAVGLQAGEKLTVEDILYALLLSSANDGAEALAYHMAGSIEEFAKWMNEEAQNLGAKNSHFVNPHGLPDPNHYVTAEDLAIIARAAMEDPEFRKIVSTYSHHVQRNLPKPVPGIPQEDFVNTNKLIWSNSSFGYEGATGIKTGTTNDAGQCLVGSAKRGDRELLTVVLKSQGSELYHDTKALLDYGFDSFQQVELISSGAVMESVSVNKGKNSQVTAIASEAFQYDFPVGFDTDTIVKQVEWKQNPVEAPVKKGDVLGYVVLMEGKQELGRVALQANTGVEVRPLFHWRNLMYPALVIIGFLMLRKWIRFCCKRKRIRRLRSSSRYYY